MVPTLDISDYRVLVSTVQEADQMFLMQEFLDIAEFERGEERERSINFVRERLISLNIIKL